MSFSNPSWWNTSNPVQYKIQTRGILRDRPDSSPLRNLLGCWYRQPETKLRGLNRLGVVQFLADVGRWASQQGQGGIGCIQWCRSTGKRNYGMSISGSSAVISEYLHITTQEFNLHCYNSLANPDKCEDAWEYIGFLSRRRSHGQKQTQQQTEN